MVQSRTGTVSGLPSLGVAPRQSAAEEVRRKCRVGALEWEERLARARSPECSSPLTFMMWRTWRPATSLSLSVRCATTALEVGSAKRDG